MHPLSSCVVFIQYCISKNNTDVAHYNFNAHPPILVVFGRDILSEYAIEW